jgi:uncharacterized membrane protein
MKIAKVIGASLFLTPFLTGCGSMMETMFTHHTLAESTVAKIAKVNAAVNFCLANDSINKN